MDLLMIGKHVDQISFFFCVYTPSTAELSTAWLKMLMIDLDNTGRVLEYTNVNMKKAILCQLPTQRVRKANHSMSQTFVNTDDVYQW